MPPAKVSKRLVIDASVARASGGLEATYPTSKHCRDFLLAVITICHRFVMTPDITDEWKEHQSSFARRWLVSMFARKKVYRLTPTVNEVLRAKVERVALSDNDRETMLKDMRLIGAAMATDRIVVSLDETVRILFNKASKRVGELRVVMWVNPDNVTEQPISWLESGAMAEEKRQLGSS